MTDKPGRKSASDAGLDRDIVRQSRREAIITLVVWCLATGYSLTYCSLYGYRTTQDLAFVLGFPSWVFWGIIAPWLSCTLFSLWFSTFYMADHDWGDAVVAEADDALWHEGELDE